MSDKSAIQWTDATWNPTRGCTKISPGCKHCYAETFAERFRGVPGHPYEQGFDLRLVPEALDLPLRWKKPRRVFVNSMSDLFHEDVPVDFIARVFAVMHVADDHVFQVLTKRAARMREVLSDDAFPYRVMEAIDCMPLGRRVTVFEPEDGWPLSNVWCGVSVENQAAADERIPHLLATPAALRFLSCEPLLGPVDLGRIELLTPEPPSGPGAWLNALTGHVAGPDDVLPERLDWVIVGGESGNSARPMRIPWAANIVAQCKAAGVPVFVKQIGAVAAREAMSADKKGGDMTLWPPSLRVREFPRGSP